MWFGCEDIPFWSNVRIMSIVAFGPVWVAEVEGEGGGGCVIMDLVFEEDLEEVVLVVLGLEDFSRAGWSLVAVVGV